MVAFVYYTKIFVLTSSYLNKVYCVVIYVIIIILNLYGIALIKIKLLLLNFWNRKY